MTKSSTTRLLALLTLLLAGAWHHALAQTPLLSSGGDWRFLDTGSNLPAGWQAIGYNDSAWGFGPSPLGYGDNDEATVVGFGPDANNKYITTYFRASFNVANPAAISNLLLRLVRDDGAVVYLNGTEIYRDNLPAGPIAYDTLALAAIGGTDETTFVVTNPPSSLLVSGVNVVAVEMHQNGTNSSDLSFDLELISNFTPVPPTVAITSPANGATLAAVNVTLLANAADVDGVITKVEFFQASTKVGEDLTSPYSFTVAGLAPGIYTFVARATDSTGLQTDSETINITVNPPPPTLVSLGANWKYLVTAAAADSAWTNLNFNDTSWPEGPGELGYGDGDEATTIGFGPDSANKYPTTYFRHKFVVNNPAAYASLAMTLVYDDGAVIYLNGVEVYRLNMPAGAIAYNTFALGAADYTPDISNLPTSALVSGTNILAVEMHQGNANSSDLSMALQIQGVLPPNVTITSPANNSTFNVPVNFTLSADASDNDGSITRVDFFDGATLLGSDTTAPYSIGVSNLLEGTHTLTAVATDNGNATGTSTPVTIQVQDLNPPTLVNASGTSNTVTVVFSKRVNQPSATTPGNYTLNLGASVSAAAYGANSNTIILTTTPLTANATYTLTVNNVQDPAGNTIAPNSQITFQVLGFVPTDIGSPAVAGSTAAVAGGFDVTGGGTDIGGTSDQFHFNYESSQRSGDFDVQVRVAGLQGADAWAEAALMARETLAANSRFAASVATPGISGCFFLSRSTAGSAAVNTGYSPATYPNTYLRLRRQGNLFTGYVSVDGSSWAPLGSATLTLPANVYVGLAVSGHSSSQSATGQFRDFGNVSGGTIGSLVIDREPLGPSSRKTGIAITEIHYNPRIVPGFTNNSLEFVEIFNSQSFFEDIGGYRLSGDIDYTFPPNTVLQPGAFLVVAREPSFVQTHYGLTGVLGPWDGATTNGLPNNGGRVRLRGRADEVLLEVNYDNQAPWPIAADGAGHSLVLARASYGEGDVRAWAASDAIDGSPGRSDPFGSDPLRNVVINEFLAHTDEPLVDFIELYNHGNTAVNLSGAWLTDDTSTNKYRIPNGTTLGARSYLAINIATNLTGFSLSSSGETILLVNSNQTRVIDAVKFDATENAVSSGRYPDGADAFYRLASRTPGTNNAALRPDPIVINEIMFNPISGDDDDEYIELHNRGNAAVNVGGWRLRDGISFNIPPGTIIASNGFLVIAKNAARLRANYPGLNATNTLGNFDGSLGNGSERLVLSFPEFDVVTNNNIVSTNINYVEVNEVTYGDGGRWPFWVDGGGSSLELKDPWGDNRQPANWADSDETGKGDWTTIEVTGTIGETLGSPVNDNLQVFLLGIGECLVDDVEVRVNNGPNLLTSNPGFETGTPTADSVGINLGGWIAQGSHDHSTFENIGLSGNRSLRLRAGSRGDNGANRIRSQAFTASGTVTLRARAKWLRGWPELMLRLHGGGLEVAGRMSIQAGLGTPGAPNSRRVPNAGPAIYDVIHSPILPSANEAVIVSARVTDPNNPVTLALKYRLDPAATYTTVNMVDSGTGGDRIAGDGIFSATIPGQAANASVAFYLEATDGLGAANTFPQDLFPIAPQTRVFPLDAVSRECVIRWGQQIMPGSLATYNLWLTAGNSNRWTVRRPLLNNTPLDGTFVYNNYRVIYNMRPQYAGSPWHRGQMNQGPSSTGNRTDYDIEFPEDDRFLGATDAVWNNPGNPSGNTTSDTSAQSEQTSYLIFKGLNVQYNYRRYMHVFCNGNQRSTTGNRSGNFIFEDSQQPNGDIVAQWFPDDTDGYLYKIEDWFEFPDNGDDFTANNDADLIRRNFTTNGVTTLQTSAYRFMWRPRSRGAGDSAGDYAPFYELLNLVSPTTVQSDPINLPAIDAVMDYEQWMRVFACQHTVGNWDSYGFNRGKNAYSYKPKNGKYHQWTWDIDFTVGLGGDSATTDNIFAASDPRITAMWNTPAIRRAYWRAYQDIVNGPLNPSYMNPILDAKAAALAANNVNFDPAAVTTIKSYIAARRSYLLSGRGGENVQVLSGLPLTAGPVSTTTANNLLTISGVAPITAREIIINGVAYAVTWTSLSNWTARIALNPGVNTLRIVGQDLRGNSVGSTQTLTATYTGAIQQPENYVVISEIMYNPLVTDAEFVELFNTSSNVTFDLTGYDFEGLDYTFPGGSLMPPRTYLVLAKNRPAFASAYGLNIPVHDQFEGNLQANGETISLIKPAITNSYMTNAVAVVLDRVRYEPVRPWPVGTNDVATQSSIQLVDPLQDNSRPLNWSTLFHPPVYSPATNFPGATNAGWRRVVFTGTVATSGTNFWIWMGSTTGGDVYVDSLHLNQGAVAESGPNLLANAGFEDPLGSAWEPLGNHSNSVRSTSLVQAGAASLRVLGSGLGSPSAGGVRQIIAPPISNSVFTLSYWFHSTQNATNLVMRTTLGSAFINTTNVQPEVIPPFSNPPMLVSPGLVNVTPGTNNARATNLAAIPPIWLNELQTSNTIGILDNNTEREPWIELYNAGPSPLSLDGLYLADNYQSNLLQWPFPAGQVIAPGEFKIVWADGEPGETAGTNLHTNFRLTGASGSLALVRVSNNSTQILDYLSYTGARAALSYGDFPDGQPFYRQTLYSASPGATNVSQAYPLYINEWMAANTNAFFDPADGQYEDWFEIYNAGPVDIDLGGFYLTDSFAAPTKYRVPETGQYIVPAGGFLLVWADGEPAQNSPGYGDLHADFSLSASGEQLAIYAPDGHSLVDGVVFAVQQTNAVSMGRYADGSASIYFMTNYTPRLPNMLSSSGNTAPVLAAIANRTNRVGQTVSFTATATDAQSPPQTLTFSLTGTVPAGASISPGGIFSWVLGSEHANTTNLITVRVADNGSPSLQATRSFIVVVLPPPTAAITTSGNMVQIGFDAIPGRTYRVDYKNELGDLNWTPLFAPFVATAPQVVINDDITGEPHRFYRIVQLD